MLHQKNVAKYTTTAKVKKKKKREVKLNEYVK
jgi:hypothetical protein